MGFFQYSEKSKSVDKIPLHQLLLWSCNKAETIGLIKKLLQILMSLALKPSQALMQK